VPGLVATFIKKGLRADSPRWLGLIESVELWFAGALGTLNEIWLSRILTSHPR
jgi:hypothetical protein